MPKGRVFIVESPSPLDLLEGRNERHSLEQVCKLVGHDTAIFLIRDLAELKQTFAYISSIECDKNDKTPLFIHISAHGYGRGEGIAIGADYVDWDELAALVQKMRTGLRLYRGPIIVILSACGANKQTMTATLAKKALVALKPLAPPEYVFVTSQDLVHWDDAVVAWTIFYHQAMKEGFPDRTAVQDLLKRLHHSGFGELTYFRWNEAIKKYGRFQAKDKQAG